MLKSTYKTFLYYHHTTITAKICRRWGIKWTARRRKIRTKEYNLETIARWILEICWNHICCKQFQSRKSSDLFRESNKHSSTMFCWMENWSWPITAPSVRSSRLLSEERTGCSQIRTRVPTPVQDATVSLNRQVLTVWMFLDTRIFWRNCRSFQRIRLINSWII